MNFNQIKKCSWNGGGEFDIQDLLSLAVCMCVCAGNNLTGLAVQFAMHFMHDCYSKLIGVATFSVVVCQGVKNC